MKEADTTMINVSLSNLCNIQSKKMMPVGEAHIKSCRKRGKVVDDSLDVSDCLLACLIDRLPAHG
jgi:hypothetical protein